MDEKNPKILIVVGHALYKPWTEILYEGQLKTWASNPSAVVKHSFAVPVPAIIRKADSYLWKLKWRKSSGKYFSVLEIIFKKPLRVKQGALHEGLLPGTNIPTLELRMLDLDTMMNFKSFSIITGCLKYDFDFLVLTTTSSYLNIPNLQKVISQLPRKKLIGGRIIRQGEVDFASGSFRVFSRDVIEEFLVHKKNFSKWRPEDLAFGYLAQHIGLNPVHISIASMDIDSLDALSKVPSSQLGEIVHFRLKSGTFENRQDVEIMRQLHSELNLI